MSRRSPKKKQSVSRKPPSRGRKSAEVARAQARGSLPAQSKSSSAGGWNLLFGLVIAAGGAFLLLDSRVGWVETHHSTEEAIVTEGAVTGGSRPTLRSQPPGASAALPTYTAPPSPTYTESADGVRIAHLDWEKLAQWCRRYGLPDPPMLPETEPAVAEALIGALGDVAKQPAAKTLGRMGMLSESLDCHDSSAEYFRRAAAGDGEDFRWPYYLGCVHQIMGRNQLAIESFVRVLDLNPSYAMTHGRLGQLYLEADRLDEAERRLHTYVNLKSEDSLGYIGLARVALARSNYTEALEYAQQGLQYGAGDFQVHYALARAYGGLRQNQMATRHFEICGELPKGMWFAMRDPLDQALHASMSTGNQLASAIDRLQGTRDWPRLISLVEQLLTRRPGDSSMMGNLASLYRKQKRFAEAHQILDRAAVIDPQLLLIDLVRAEVLLAESRFDEAVEVAHRAGTQDDQAYRAFNVQGRALLLLKRTDEAIEAMQRCVSLKPGHAGNTLVLAEALRSAGRREQAIVYYQRVLELVPGQPTASKRLAELGS